MKFIHIMDGPPLFTNGFLLVGSEGNAVAVDPSADIKKFAKLLEENNAKLTHIFLTHGHFDHVGSVAALREKYGAKVYMNTADEKMAGLKADASFEDGSSLTVDDMELRIFFTPGHSPGSVCIRMGNYLFTGDTLFASDIGRTDLPGGSPAEMRSSLQKIVALTPDNPQVLPGHEEFSTMDEERKVNPYLRF